MLVYIGTQVTEKEQGIFAAHLDETNGDISCLGAVAEVERPTFVLADPARPVVYAVSEVGNAGDRAAEVFSFVREAGDASLALLSRAPSGGCGATHLALHPSGRRMLVANFGGGQVASLPVAPDGDLGAPLSVRVNHGSGPHRRQSKPHAHGVTLDPTGQYLLVPDMGADRIFVYRHDERTGELAATEPAYAQLPAGSGPRLTLFGHGGRFVYLLTELSAEIFVFRWLEEEGRMLEVASLVVDPDAQPDDRSAAAFAISEDGRFLVASNRRASTLHVYAIDADTGALELVQTISSGGGRPWSADFCPGGRWMVVTNQGTNNVCVFAVDRHSGRLSAVPGGITVPTPTSATFVA